MSRKLPEIQPKKSKLVEHFQLQAAAATAAVESKIEDQQNAKSGLRVAFHKLAPQSKAEGGANVMLSVTKPLQSLLGPKWAIQNILFTSYDIDISIFREYILIIGLVFDQRN